MHTVQTWFFVIDWIACQGHNGPCQNHFSGEVLPPPYEPSHTKTWADKEMMMSMGVLHNVVYGSSNVGHSTHFSLVITLLV